MKSLNLLVCCGVINHYYYSHVNNFSITLTFNPKLTIVYHYGVMLQQLSWINYGDFRKKRFVLYTMLPLMPPVMICFVNLTVSIYTNVIVIKYLFAHLLYSIPHVHLLVTFLIYTSQIPHMHYGQIMIIYALKCHFHIKKCINPPFHIHVLFCGINCQLNYAQIILLLRVKKDYILLNSITNDYQNLMA